MEEYSRIIQTSDQRLAQLITQNVVNNLPDVQSVLDIGCGDGIVRQYLAPTVRYCGLDITDACIYEQRKSEYISYISSNSLNDAIDDSESFDCALLLDVLEHTTSFHELAIRVAKKRPKFIVISLPNELFLYDRIRFMFGIEHPAHCLDLIDLPEGFKHQYLINIERAQDILVRSLGNYSYTLKTHVYRELKPKKFLFRPFMKLLSNMSSPQLWSMGSIFVFNLQA